MLKQLHEALEKNFVISDILLEVGSSKAAAVRQ
jgi:hypothetical protein